ncbi:hypothetical protein ACG33_08815 [Steroidobacter denitrificans]|uniref:Virulence-associated protein E-like domain-containing protein n=1 Tax=Steroidobacter denitrificans TaxID=465721 RepID=A0A127F9V1_STEDE|nr:VapE domain-containing protein [Steroidobacter denitrificans]AMN47193.1 hypothetical protein ACG33_08815 [Steroidobacter denitrificans]
MNLVRLTRDRDQLWAEAHARYKQGERWHLDSELESLAAKQAEGRRLRDPWHDELSVMLKTGSLKDRDELLPGEALKELGVGAEKLTQFNAGRVGKIFRALGWRKKSPSARVYVRPKEAK